MHFTPACFRNVYIITNNLDLITLIFQRKLISVARRKSSTLFAGNGRLMW